MSDHYHSISDHYRIIYAHLTRGAMHFENIDPAIIEWYRKRYPDQDPYEMLLRKYTTYTGNFLDFLPQNEEQVLMDFEMWDNNNQAIGSDLYARPGEKSNLLIM